MEHRSANQVRQLPHQEPRVETGPVQFGTDWPGVFIRGDNAMAKAMLLHDIITGTISAEHARIGLTGLYDTMRSALEGHGGELLPEIQMP